MKRVRPRQHIRKLKSGKKIIINKGRHKTIKRKRKNILFHGTSEESLAKMGTQGGLKPQKGILWLTDDPTYARFLARQSVKGTKFDPVIIAIDKPEDVERMGRHFISKKAIPVRSFRKIHAGNLTNIRKETKKNYGFFGFKKPKDEYIRLDDPRFQTRAALKDSNITYGKVSKISGKKIGRIVTASGIIVPVILPAPLMAAAGSGIEKGIEHVKLIHTDEHDKPYKIPRIEIQQKNRK